MLSIESVFAWLFPLLKMLIHGDIGIRTVSQYIKYCLHWYMKNINISICNLYSSFAEYHDSAFRVATLILDNQNECERAKIQRELILSLLHVSDYLLTTAVSHHSYLVKWSTSIVQLLNNILVKINLFLLLNWRKGSITSKITL